MLQRAASNAYSWWWASHVRTKQSKWLEQSLQGMYSSRVYNDDDQVSFFFWGGLFFVDSNVFVLVF